MSSDPAQPVTAPIRPTERIVAIDILRGFALLGILIMNIQGFAMPAAAYSNPTVYGDLNGANRWVWTLSHIFADQKFMTIFSLLFGAGIVLMSAKLDARGQRAWALHYRRTFWLLLIGLAHAYLLWSGDILVAYALCGFWVYWLRRLRPGWQMALGILVVSIPALILLVTSLTMQFTPPEMLQELRADWQPASETIAQEVASYRGGWLTQMDARVPRSAEFQTVGLLFWGLWRAGGLMLMGMALYRWGVLTGSRSRGFYFGMVILGLAIGLPVVSWGAVQNFANNWTMEFSKFGLGAQPNYWGQPLRQRRLHRAADAVRPLARPAPAAERAGRDRADRPVELSTADDPGHSHLLRSRPGAVRFGRTGGADRHCRRDLGVPTGGVTAVAASLSLRAIGVVVAFAQLLAAAADGDSVPDAFAHLFRHLLAFRQIRLTLFPMALVVGKHTINIR